MPPQKPCSEQHQYSELGSHSATLPSSSGCRGPHFPSGLSNPAVGYTGLGWGAAGATGTGCGAAAGLAPAFTGATFTAMRGMF